MNKDGYNKKPKGLLKNTWKHTFKLFSELLGGTHIDKRQQRDFLYPLPVYLFVNLSFPGRNVPPSFNWEIRVLRKARKHIDRGQQMTFALKITTFDWKMSGTFFHINDCVYVALLFINFQKSTRIKIIILFVDLPNLYLKFRQQEIIHQITQQVRNTFYFDIDANF